MTPQLKCYTQTLQIRFMDRKKCGKMWQDFQKDIKKYDLILKSGNYKKGRNTYKIRFF